MKSILVTGGTGLVGNGLKTISKDYEEKYNFIYISSKNYNLTSLQETKAMFEKYRPNYVIHLAACVGGLYKNMNNKVIMLEKNLMINYNVIKCSHDYKVEKLISCLSTCIFPDKVTYPIDESLLHNGPPHHSNDAYAYAKRMLEIHSKAYRENYGDNFICVSPTNVYGPHDNFNLEDAHVLPALIHKCYLAKEDNEDFIIRGTGNPLRQFIFSEDLAKLIMIIMENHNDDNLILSPPESDELSIKDLATIIAKEFNYEERIKFDLSYSDGQYKKTVSVNKLLSLIGDFQYTKIEDGIKKSVNWFIQNKDSIKN
jgi:GDP-L-fucose synthase